MIKILMRILMFNLKLLIYCFLQGDHASDVLKP
jgi:hypothetical protein